MLRRLLARRPLARRSSPESARASSSSSTTGSSTASRISPRRSAFAEALDLDPRRFLELISGAPFDMQYAHWKAALDARGRFPGGLRAQARAQGHRARARGRCRTASSWRSPRRRARLRAASSSATASDDSAATFLVARRTALEGALAPFLASGRASTCRVLAKRSGCASTQARTDSAGVPVTRRTTCEVTSNSPPAAPRRSRRRCSRPTPECRRRGATAIQASRVPGS